MYEFLATLIRVVDADTIDFLFDLGFNVKIKERVRLGRINAWEKTGKEKKKGLKAKRYVQWILRRTKSIEIFTEKRGKYNRYVAEVIFYRNSEEPKSLNDLLVEKGHAVYKKY